METDADGRASFQHSAPVVIADFDVESELVEPVQTVEQFTDNERDITVEDDE
jgi:hypothetical protein